MYFILVWIYFLFFILYPKPLLKYGYLSGYLSLYLSYAGLLLYLFFFYKKMGDSILLIWLINDKWLIDINCMHVLNNLFSPWFDMVYGYIIFSHIPCYLYILLVDVCNSHVCSDFFTFECVLFIICMTKKFWFRQVLLSDL